MIKIILIKAILLFSLLKGSWINIDQGLSYQIFDAEKKEW